MLYLIIFQNRDINIVRFSIALVEILQLIFHVSVTHSAAILNIFSRRKKKAIDLCYYCQLPIFTKNFSRSMMCWQVPRHFITKAKYSGHDIIENLTMKIKKISVQLLNSS
jgi:hypothetical protein